LCPPTQLSDRWLVEPVGGKLRVVDPVGPAQSCLKLAQVEGVTGVATSKLFQLDVVPAVRRGLYVDQIPGESPVGQCANLGATTSSRDSTSRARCAQGAANVSL
jgi:hypothetical protein